MHISSYNEYAEPPLEYIKLVCEHVFSLDPAFYKEALALKKNLLAEIQVKEFAPEAHTGLEPSLVLVLPDVICKQCQSCQDLDLCRDPELNAKRWACEHCETEMEKSDVEKRLVALLNRRVTSYQMQDLKCKRCKMVKNKLVGEYCDCTGSYLQVLGDKQPSDLKSLNMLNSQTDIKLFCRLLRNFAFLHEMGVLEDVAQQCLDM